MNRCKLLMDVFMKDNAMDESNDKGRKIKNAVLGVFALVCIFIPITVGTGFFTFFITHILYEEGNINYSFGIHLMLGVISIFVIIFGISVVFNELYFSTDIEKLLPLPLHPWEIAVSKFMAIVKGENVMTAILVFACMLGFAIGAKIGIIKFIIGMVVAFFLPVAPTAVCGILVVLLMSFTPFIRSREATRKISMFIMVAIFAFMVYVLLSLGDMDIDLAIQNAAKDDNKFMLFLNILFPQLKMLVGFLTTGNVAKLLLYILITVGYVLIFAGVSELLYMNSVTNLVGSEGGRKKKADIKKETKSRSFFMALFLKEQKMLIRTPVFFSNCIIITFVWPVFIFIIDQVTHVGFDREKLAGMYSGGYETAFFIAAFSIAIIMSSMNSLGSNAFSREGKGISFMKYIPVDYKIQWNVKAAISIFWSVLGIVPFMIAIMIYVKVPVFHQAVIILISLAAIWFVTYLGMLLDSINPKLLWEDALSALRENYNTFFEMAICLVVCAILGVIFYLLSVKVSLGSVISGLIIFAILLFTDIILYYRSMNRGLENIKEIGEL